MLFAAGAAVTALDAVLSPLFQPKKTSGTTAGSGTGFQVKSFADSGQTSAEKLLVPGDAAKPSSSGSSISPQTMSALIDAQSDNTSATSTAKPKDPLADLFALLDADGDSKVSKSEFETALGAGGTNLKNADSVFAKLDTDGDGSVSQTELAAALKGKGRHHAQQAAEAGGADALSQTQGATATTKTNADGSVTTTLTYADGSKVTSTSAASSSKNASANLLERLIQQQAQMISSTSTAAGSSLSVSA